MLGIVHMQWAHYFAAVRSRREKVPSIVIFFSIVGSGAEQKALNQTVAVGERKRLTIGQVLLFHFALDAVHHLVDRRAI